MSTVENQQQDTKRHLTHSRQLRKLRSVEISSSMPWDVDSTIEELLAERTDTDRPLRIRINPAIFSPRLKRMVVWRQVTWGVGIRTLEEAQALRTGLQLFFRAAAEFGIGGVVARLQEMLRGAPERELPELEEDEEEREQ